MSVSVRLSVRTTSLTLAAAGLAVAGTVLTGDAASAAAVNNNRVQLTATLSGAQEVPGPGDTDGRGVGTLDVKVASGRICYTLQVSGIEPATAAHIHEARIGQPGPVVRGLIAPSDGSSSGCFTDRGLARDIFADPADYYLNVHNAKFPGGAIRGQLG